MTGFNVLGKKDLSWMNETTGGVFTAPPVPFNPAVMEREKLEEKLDECPTDVSSRRRLAEIMKAEEDEKVDIQEWMLSNNVYPGLLHNGFIVLGQNYPYFLGEASRSFNYPIQKVPSAIHSKLPSDYKEECYHWRYYKTRKNAEEALRVALISVGVLNMPNPCTEVLPENKIYWVPEGVTIKTLLPVAPTREQEIQRLQAILDKAPDDWATRMELGNLYQEDNQEMAKCQWWMAENQKCSSHSKTPDQDYHIGYWGRMDNPNKYADNPLATHMYLDPDLFKLLGGDSGNMEWWNKSTTRQEAEDRLSEALGKLKIPSL